MTRKLGQGVYVRELKFALVEGTVCVEQGIAWEWSYGDLV